MHKLMPIFKSLLDFHENNTLPFNFPGHKRGLGTHRLFREFIGGNVLSIDVSAFQQVDSLHKPEGPIKHAQELAADAFGADVTYFCVQGTSGAIHTMIMSVVEKNEKIIIPRNVHKSVTAGIILKGAIPVYMQPEIDHELGVALNVTPESVRKALENNQDAKAVLIVNPTYYGVSPSLKEIADIVHGYNIPLLVDEAHGPHFHFHKGLPPASMDSGADMCAQSTHKIIGSMSQSSMLHIKTQRIDANKVKSTLNLLQTTSPSYILLASLDSARMQMMTDGENLITHVIEVADYVRKEINKIPGLYCFGNEGLPKAGAYALDVTKITITCKNLGITGYELERILSEKYKIQAEMADMYNVLCVLSFGTTKENGIRLVETLKTISKYHIKKPIVELKMIDLPKTPEQILTPGEAFWKETVSKPLQESIGEISAEFLMPYPPGIPILCPGERITQDIINYVVTLKNARILVQGTNDINVEYINVVKSNKG